MGLFSSKKTVTVSSTIYNMAGDENDRPNFLKGTLFGSVMSNSPSLSDDISTGYFNGPGLKQRQFFRYADRVNLTGMPTATIVNNPDLDVAIVAGEIPVTPTPAGLEINVYSAQVNDGDFEDWIERWIYENHPDRIAEDWLGEYNQATNMFSVEFPDADYFEWANTTAPVFDYAKRYVVAKYIEFLDEDEDTVVTGSPTTGVTTLPSLTGFTNISDTGTSTSVTLQRNRTTIYTYSNGDPPETHEDNVDADVTASLNTSVEVWERDVVTNQVGIEVEGEKQIWNFTGTDVVVGGYSNVVVTYTDMGGGVIRTETATTTGEQVQARWTTRYDTQALYIGRIYGGQKVFIYEVGTGNAVLDGLVSAADASGFQEFYPIMPLRIDNDSLAEPAYDSLRAEMKKAYRRAYNGENLDDLIETIDTHPDEEDIDYAYLTWGCSLNTKENSAKKYIYNFFEKLMDFQIAGSASAMTNFAAEIATYNAAKAALEAWEATDWESGAWASIPPRPVLPKLGIPATNKIRLRNNELGYDFRIQWTNILIEQFTGTYDSNPTLAGFQPAQRGDLLLVNGPTTTWSERDGYNTGGARSKSNKIESLYIYWQIDTNTYRRMTINGLVHQNFIYKGKNVKITSREALEDDEESGFLVPLHYPTLSEMSIVDYTQLATANSFIVFNSYEVTKQRWWQRGIFRILIIIAIIVVAVILFPGAFAGGAGVLGGNAALGAALGLSGTAAIVAGVVANYIASILIAELLKAVGTQLFGEKWGAVFATIASFALGAALSGLNLFSAEGIMSLGNAVANAYSGWVQGDIAERAEALNEDRKEYEQRMEYIDNLISNLGGNDLNFNPIFLTEFGRQGNGRGGKGYMPETSDEYIRRTTMTGTDIVELSHSMVYDFVEVSRTLPRN